jgi:Uncharacterized protein conserved in bacteria
MLGWEIEVAIPTRIPRGSGYPTCYKLDIANKALKIGVEVDGFSHTSLARQAQDRKKDSFFAGIGWTVLRFTNEEVLSDPTKCVQMVMSIISK